jgi:phosphoserine phosphatase
MKKKFSPKLVVFALDNVLIERADDFSETWEAINCQVGDWQRSTNRAFAEEIAPSVGFEISLVILNSMIRGKTRAVFEKAAFDYRLAEGAREIPAELSRRGIETAILTGTFLRLANRVGKEVGIPRAMSVNQISFDASSRITEIITPRADGSARVWLLRQFLERLQIAPKEVLIIGNRIGNREVFEATGNGIAVGDAPEELKKAAATSVEKMPEILSLL